MKASLFFTKAAQRYSTAYGEDDNRRLEAIKQAQAMSEKARTTAKPRSKPKTSTGTGKPLK